MMAHVKGALVGLTIALATLLGVALMMPLALAKLLLPFTPVRHVVDRALNAIATAWIGLNSAGWTGSARRAGTCRVWRGSSRAAGISSTSNHQSWVDILVLQKIFNRRIPMLKFFLKRELIWVPVIGFAWWALDFPFMRRRGGQGGAADLEAGARSPARNSGVVPTSVINFLEGTRYTRAKHDAQRSPYRHLLKPKVGGIATALTTLGPPVSPAAGRDHRLSGRPTRVLDADVGTAARGRRAGAATRDPGADCSQATISTTPAFARACRSGSTICGPKRTG